jgi:hypothetical protein
MRFPAPFVSAAAFRATFSAGLERLLDEDAIGLYLLVQANACLDADLCQRLQSRLLSAFRRLEEEVGRALRERREIAAPEDDLAVFRQILVMGFAAIGAVEARQTGPWEVQFNPFRALRPPRLGQGRLRGIQAPFDAQAFHFNRPFLRRETCWSGPLGGMQVDLLYNKFPFVELHALLVPDRTANRPQFLERGDHRYIWGLTECLGERIPGLGLGYNSYGAFASVNHLHFQWFVRSRPWPVMHPRWRHNGGDEDYPTGCERLCRETDAWECLAGLHRTETPYNALYLPGEMYCFPRRPQGSHAPAGWSNGCAWHELAGGMTVFTREWFESLDADAIAMELGRLSLA